MENNNEIATEVASRALKLIGDLNDRIAKQDTQSPMTACAGRNVGRRLAREDFERMLQDGNPHVLLCGYPESDNAGTADDIALIQCFWGNDPDRIEATTRAVRMTLKSSPRPAEFVFVEVQENRSKAAFGWLAGRGVKYVFVKRRKENDGLLLKTALWNIGVRKTTSSRLVFVDSDTVFCNGNWLEPVSAAFAGNDVISPAGWYYHENHENRELAESFGHRLVSSGEKDFSGHPGLTFGMTRAAYETYGGFEAFSSHDDVWIWQKIVGSSNMPDKPEWTPYRNSGETLGLPFKVGSTEECCCHLFHGKPADDVRRLFGLVTYLYCETPFEDVVYDPNTSEKLPVWSEGVGEVVRRSFAELAKTAEFPENAVDYVKDVVSRKSFEVFGEIENICGILLIAGFEKDFLRKDLACFMDRIDALETSTGLDLIPVCISKSVSKEEADDAGIDLINPGKNGFAKCAEKIALLENQAKILCRDLLSGEYSGVCRGKDGIFLW